MTSCTKLLPHCWPFVWGMPSQRPPMRNADSFVLPWTNCWTKGGLACDQIHHYAYYMICRCDVKDSNSYILFICACLSWKPLSFTLWKSFDLFFIDARPYIIIHSTFSTQFSIVQWISAPGALHFALWPPVRQFSNPWFVYATSILLLFGWNYNCLFILNVIAILSLHSN